MKRFKAGNVRVRGVEDVAPAVVEAQGLKRVAAALGRSGLVQVEEGQRVFGMHQLLQQAVGRELGWGEPCARMRRLLHARCGQFGDEIDFDVGLYGVMREVAAAAVAAAGRVKAEGGRRATRGAAACCCGCTTWRARCMGLTPSFPIALVLLRTGRLWATLWASA